LDAFLKGIVEEAGLEEPSVDFTQAVLSRIETASKTNTVFDYKPLISKKVWWFLAAMVSGLFIYIVFGNPDMATNLPYLLSLKKLTEFNLLGKLPNMTGSSTVLYAMTAMAIFVVIQVFLLDRRTGENLKVS
jgi:hypothetical protein